MKKLTKIFFTLVFASLIMPVLNAASVEVKDETELLNAIKNGGEIILKNDITVSKTIEIKGQKVIIDMNGNTLTVQSYIDLWEGLLEFTGKGTLKDNRNKEKVSATIWVEGSTDIAEKDFSTLNVGKDVTIETTEWAIAVSNPDGKKLAYGAVVNFNGTINSSAKKGGGITIFGTVNNNGSLVNSPVINISKTAKVNATGENAFALYGAGIGIWNINGGTFKSVSTFGIKSGKVVINDGEFIANGTPKEGTLYGNGIIDTGSTIQIESNDGYTGSVDIFIAGGKFISEKGLSIYHYPLTEAKNSLESLMIAGGEFSGDIKMLDEDNVTINGGTFTTDKIMSYIPSTYEVVKSNNKYIVSNITYMDVEGASAKIISEGKENRYFANAGESVEIKATPEEGYYIKKITVIGKDKTSTVVDLSFDNTFIMPDYAVTIYVETARCLEKDGNVVLVDKEISYDESIDEKVVEDLLENTVNNKKSGLLEAIKLDELEIEDYMLVEFELDTKLTKYDEKTNTLVFDIKPIYYVEGVKKGVVSNDLIDGLIKINLPVPTNIKDTHVKVIHRSGEKIVDEKVYEVKTTEDGKKYITIETTSFSTFELSFYTPVVENPKTGDNVMFYVGTMIISLLGISLVIVKKHF